MTQTHDPASMTEPAPRRRRWWPPVLLTVLSLLLLLAGLAQGGGHECCAIDCEAYPEACERRAHEHHQREQTARSIAFGAYVASAAALGYAVVLLGRR